MKSTKKIVSLLLVLSLTAALLAGCAGGEKAQTSETPAPASAGETAAPAESGGKEPAEPAAKKHIKNLVVGTTSQPTDNSIMQQSSAVGKFNYNSITYANLFYPDSKGEMQPYFLTSYQISEDSKRLDLTFPTTAVWHDGVPVTVDDVVFTFEFRRDRMKSKALENLTEIKINGPDSVTLIFSEPDAYYFVQNSTLTTFMIPKHIWENVEDYTAYKGEDAAIGCGPYRLVSVDKDANISYFEAVPENSFLGELTVDSITLKSYSSQDSMLMAMANGEIDLMYDYANPVSNTLLDIISGNKDIDMGASAYIGCNQVTLGMDHGPNQDHAFREAAVKSLNWKLICQLCNGEYGQIPGSGIIPPACKGHDDSLWKMYQDIDEANAILDKAGYLDKNGDGLREMPDGSPFTYKVTSQYATKKQELFNRIAEVLVSSLRAVGVDAFFDTESIASSEANKMMLNSCDFDMYIGYTTSGVATYRTAFWYMVPRDIAALGGAGSGNEWGKSYHNEELNNTYLSLTGATSKEEYLAAVHKLQSIASRELFGFALCWEQCFFPYRTDKYQGFENIDSVGVVHAETFYTLTAK